MSRVAYVDRAELGLGPLNLWNPTEYVLVDGSFGPGQVTWNRKTVESPFVHGRYLVTATMSQQIGTLVVQCRALAEDNINVVAGNPGAVLQQRIEALIAAFSQFTYGFAYDYDGVFGSWNCEPADYTVGPAGQFDEFDLSFYEQAVTLTVPHFPFKGKI